MKANEFRLGNLVIDEDGDILPVEQIGKGIVYHPDGIFSDTDTISPIFITEDHFKNKGFYLAASNCYRHEKLGSIYFSKRPEGWIVKTKEGSHLTMMKDYHQLQNFFYSITGEEL